MDGFEASRDFARSLDDTDALASYRSRFAIPRIGEREAIYLVGNSLGLMPHAAREAVELELDAWASQAVDAHFKESHPWYTYHESVRDNGATLVGAKPAEVVFMNGLTVNLHLMLTSFYRPTPEKYKIMIEAKAFPSDRYALQSQVRLRGFDPSDALLELKPDDGVLVGDAEVLRQIEQHGSELALVMLGGINYFSGQLLDMEAIAEAGHSHGALVGFDLAHSVGNVPHELHRWNVDFAVWCTYKYLNSGPGSVAGCFVHENHLGMEGQPRLAGWWGNDPTSRFRMDAQRDFVPVAGADGWQLSNPPILSLAPVRASLDLFAEVGMSRLREKSIALTRYAEFMVDRLESSRVQILTPRAVRRRGAQLSLRIDAHARDVLERLTSQGVVADFRPPDVIRVAPVPLYNSYEDVYEFGCALAQVLKG